MANEENLKPFKPGRSSEEAVKNGKKVALLLVSLAVEETLSELAK